MAILFAVGLLVAFAATLIAVSLRPSGFYSGLVLFGIVVLAGYNVFKKVPFLPLGSSSAWLQFHYLGWLTMLLFACISGALPPPPIPGRPPRAAYVGVAGSGVLGLFLALDSPRLRTCGEEVLYERIPADRRGCRARSRSWRPAPSRSPTAPASRISTPPG